MYNIVICTDGTNMDMCLCVLLAAICMVYYWLDVDHLQYASVQIIYRDISLSACIVLCQYSIFGIFVVFERNTCCWHIYSYRMLNNVAVCYFLACMCSNVGSTCKLQQYICICNLAGIFIQGHVPVMLLHVYQCFQLYSDCSEFI